MGRSHILGGDRLAVAMPQPGEVDAELAASFRAYGVARTAAARSASGVGSSRVGAGAAACRTSSRVMVPPRPVPRSVVRSTPCCWASRRTSGECTWEAGTSWTTSAGVGLGCAGSAGSAPSGSIVASGPPTGTTVPGSTRSSETTPLRNVSTSIAALAVSTTATMSPLCTESPGWTSHSSKVPSSMSAPSEGIVNEATGQPATCRIVRRAASAMVAGCGSAASSRCFG